MRIKTNIVKLLAVLVILGSLVAIAAVPAGAVVAGFTLNPLGGPVGGPVTISATNYPTNSVLTAKFDGVPVATSPATVTVSGTTTVFTITVPTTTAGVHVVTVLQDGINPQTQNFTVQPSVLVTSPTSTQGPVGSAITVVGTGFSGGSVSATVTIGTGLQKQTIGVVTVDSTGSFTLTGTVPSVAAGAQVVSAKDGAGNSALGSDNNPVGTWNNTDTFGVTPTLAVSPISGLAGSKATISGSGWTASSTVSLTLTGQAWTTVSTDASGNIVPGAQGTITASAPLGANQITGYDTNYPAVPAATATFTVVARALTVTPVSSGPRGTQLLITGTSMTPSNPQATPPLVSQILAGQLKMGVIGLNSAAITIDTQGTISPTTVYVPAGAPLGANTITATDNSGLVAAATFTVTQPAITINPATGPRGTSVIVNGAGWLPPSTVLSTAVVIGVYNYGQTTGTLSIPEVSTIPDSSGNFAASITIPNVPTAGTYSIYARDANANAAVLATFTVPGAGITVSPTSGVALTTITVTGTGFKPYWGITVSIGGYNFPTQVFSDVLGAFTFSGQVPGLAPGATVVSASDSTSTATTFFTINQGAPTVASIVTPIATQLVRIWGYTGGTWYMYDPLDAAGSNLTTLTSGAGYWVDVNAACTLVYGGYSYALSTGWNLIGWR